MAVCLLSVDSALLMIFGIAIYRLDRLTSGVVVFCKTETKTKEMMESVKQRLLKKEYVCRVDGEFPRYLGFLG